MFDQLILKNFRKHSDLTIDFKQGLIAIRGANEAGKTTVQEAITYALFGAKGLREPLGDVVTYGMAETALQVTLRLVGGTTVTRSKRGAEITNTGVLCTGQTECTKYFEKLLGCTADMATKLMMAKQSALQGALTGGPTEAAQMIETLADFDLINRVVDLVQHKLPTGNTSALEEVLARQDAELANLEMPDEGALVQLELDEAAFNRNYGEIYGQQKEKSTLLQGLDVAGARRFMVELAGHKTYLVGLQPMIDDANAKAQVRLDPPDADSSHIEAWRTALMDLKGASARRAAYVALQAIPEPEVTWEGTAQSFRDEVALATRALEGHANTRAMKQIELAAIAARRITETNCAFCGKDLTEVPEVTRRNIEADSDYRQESQFLDQIRDIIAAKQADLSALHDVEEQARAYETAVSRYGAFITRIDDRYPCRWQWIGEPPTAGDIEIGYNAMIQRAETERAAYGRALGARDAAQTQWEALNLRAAALMVLIEQAGLREVEVSVTIRQAEALEREIADLGAKLQAATLELQAARSKLALAKQAAEQAGRRRDDLTAAIETTERSLKGQRFNNALVKRVRAARPVISDKLWSIVLASVSAQFSQIRGVPSVITRSDNGFKCDGQSVAGLSGSTLDALGLAIRIALTKTFLPNSRFMMLDEPGAACDDEREGNMLGLIAASDFDQTLLVTHSAIADAFATQVVAL